MCGIVGFIGNQNAKDIILKGLTRLEYRGYDSAGMSLFNHRYQIYDVYKDVGRVAKLIQLSEQAPLSNIGIGHTRWATHGKVNKENSHPHFSQTKRFMIVHNGVIDNDLELKDQYLRHAKFESETDTEVIAQLIETFAQTLHVENAITTTLKLLHGSYALLILDASDPEKIYAAKSKSPLLIGKGETGWTIASDLMALVGTATDYYPMRDQTLVVATKSRLNMFDLHHQPITVDFRPIEMDDQDTTKGDFPHFMLKEIHEQPSVIRRILTHYSKEGDLNIPQAIKDEIWKSDRIYMLAAGTSMHAALIGKVLFETILHKPVDVHIASEFAYQKPILSFKPFFILITQSGETADLRACLTLLNQALYRSLTITNVITSTLAREATYALELFAGPEIAVASTKAYVAQISLLALIADQCANEKPFDLKKELTKVALSMESFLNRETIKATIEPFLTKRNCFYIGRGMDYFVALEAALKLKEISYIQTEGFAAGELKHGTIALIEEGTPVIAIISDPRIQLNTRSNLKEVMSRGANTLVISLKSSSQPQDPIILEDVHWLLSSLITVIPTQLIAYYAALLRGHDIDKPRNLAKSVTVE